MPHRGIQRDCRTEARGGVARESAWLADIGDKRARRPEGTRTDLAVTGADSFVGPALLSAAPHGGAEMEARRLAWGL